MLIDRHMRAIAVLDIMDDVRETPAMAKPLGAQIVASLLLLASGLAVADDDNRNNMLSLENALAQGRFSLELRPRWNRIAETDKPELTEVGTVRAVAGWRSAPWRGWRLTLEAIHTDHFGGTKLNDDGALIFESEYPLLPDPRYTGANQAHLEYAGIEGLQLKLGRQLVRMDNQRWVSDNDFRQIPQLFDGLAATYTGFAGTRLTAARFARVRTTSGETQSLKLTLLNAAWNPAPGHAVAAYGYFHDQAENGAFTGFADSSYRVAGARAEGAFPLAGSFELPYLVEAASQRPYAAGDARVRANYWRAGGGVATREATLRFDYEVKGSNGGEYGLQMPLTDFYSFNGWTLHFFNTPAEGLRDRWMTARYVLGPATLFGEVHRFRSDFGRLDFGRELDVGVTYELLPNALLRLQHARYDAGTGQVAPDIRKTWLTLIYTY
jgi:hypothetical protein